MKVTRDIFVSDEPEEAIRKTKLTLKRVGELKAVVPGQHIDGVIQFGVSAVTVQVRWRAEELGPAPDKGAGGVQAMRMVGTTLTLEGESEDATGRAVENAVERFEDAYRHFDQPDYKPDRLGVMPLTIIGIVVAVVLLGVALWRVPAFRKRLPSMPAAYLKTDQQKKAEAAAEKEKKEMAGETEEEAPAVDPSTR